MMKTDNNVFDNYQEILDNKSKIIDESIKYRDDGHNPIGHMDIIITIEELSELQKSLTKTLRNEGDRSSVLEELADVSICLDYIRKIFKITSEEEQKAIYIKLNRIKDRMN